MCFILLLALSACAPAQQQPQAPAQQPKDDVDQPVQEPFTAKQEISAEVKELLNKSNTRIRSIYYKYRGPETGSNFHEFYVKGDKIKYNPYLAIKTLDRQDSYDTIFIDTEAKSAQSYCVAAYCKYGGLKGNLNYDDAYIDTIFDWLKVTQATKVGEEVIDSRSTWKLETNKGILWVDTFYGIPLKIESGGKTYKFEQISVNAVTDEDITPS